MDRHVLAPFEAFNFEISQAKDPKQVARALHSLGSRFGFRALAISETLPVTCDQAPHEILAEYWPEGWPIEDSRKWLSSYHRYRWIEWLPGSLTLHASDFPRWMQSHDDGLAEKTNKDELMLVPLPQADGRLGIVIYIGQRQDDSTQVTALLEAAAFIAFQRSRVLRNSFRTDVLTRQQRLICSFLAVGKSSAEIGFILGITEATVDQHVRHCKKRLGTSNRTATVIEAIRRGQLLSVSSNAISVSAHPSI